MFSKLYIGEVKKLIRPKSLIVLSIILVLMLVIYAISYNFLMGFEISAPEPIEEGEVGYEEYEEANIGEMIFGSQYSASEYTASEVQSLIAQTKNQIKELEKSTDENSMFYRLGVDPVYEAKGYLKALEYIRDNNLYNQKIEIHSQTAIFSQKSAEAFAQGFFGLLLTIVIIYGIVIAAGSFSSEMKNGTLKILFMRPITRNKLTTAKMLALFTMIATILLGGTLISYLYGLIKYGAAEAVKGLIVFNAISVFQGSKGLLFFMNIMFGLIQAFALCLFAFALGTVSKNRILAIIASILLYLELLSAILSLFKLGRFLFTTNANLGIYFGVSSVIPAGGTFFLALPMFIVYISLFVVSTYVIINKRDIA